MTYTEFDWYKVFETLSLTMNILGTVILAIPLFKITRILKDEVVIDMGTMKDNEGNIHHKYSYPWLAENIKFGFWGLGLIGLSSLIQLALTLSH